MSQSTTPAEKPKKRRFYHNLKDAYTMVKRTFGWLGWAMLAIVVVVFGGSILWGITSGHWISYPFLGLMLTTLLCLILLTVLLNPALYQQIDGHPGAVGAVLSRQSRGWIVSDTPAVVTQEKDVVWRAIGRPGVVLISEGPSNRVQKLLDNERRRIKRLAPTVPIHLVQYGHEEGQVPLPKVAKQMRSFKNVLNKREVPMVDRRLATLKPPTAQIPKGIDPNRVRPSKKAMYGRG
ncbi:hypothetical protein BSR29_04095 [Boudabousia liubingyangii]|uniref:DUF4191 domain-containing protein n=1 Tax=Boudabousia liubingyangii TaxID=1921764 RepID=A0A1Q5PNA6_9ACTO|nr:DUF4191 domain-containing protein [Boudabousia liubingyangii]OKL47599.1 hypothetical protein BSR28_03665 [Boudabousia liubingyangii]OKL49023.1 hypothetical protein BSR29_04095 [Boudabousia liubingyangii]